MNSPAPARTACLLTVFLLASPTLFAQSVHRVPSQHPTIAAALAAAGAGDIVLVAAGTYRETLRWPDRDGIQLLSEEGPERTIIDGDQQGTVVTIGRSLSRATVLEGFTIRNGFLGGGLPQARGGGILISDQYGPCSPTIRGNIIADNRLEGTFWSYGAGIYIDARNSSPLIIHNVIENNVGTGSRPYGTGVYARAANAEIIGNVIRNNTSDSDSWGYGAGVFCARGSTVIAGNLITGNSCVNGIWNYGGGILVDSDADVQIVNNTIDNNTVGQATFFGGGGINIGRRANSVTIHNNIISNTGNGGGIRMDAAPTTLSIDFNVVWANAGGNYVRVTPGPNDFEADPMFRSAKDRHLFELSPCIDAGSDALHQAVNLIADIDGDPRPLYGFHGGPRDSAFRVDIGADEYSVAGLAVASPARLGATARIDMSGPPSWSYVAMIDVQLAPALTPPLGVFFLTPTPWLAGVGSVPGSLSLPVPNLPILVGKRAYVQAVAGRGTELIYTNLVDLVIH